MQATWFSVASETVGQFRDYWEGKALAAGFLISTIVLQLGTTHKDTTALELLRMENSWCVSYYRAGWTKCHANVIRRSHLGVSDITHSAVIFRYLCYSTVSCFNSVWRGSFELDKEEEILIIWRHVTNRIINSMSVLRINHGHLQAVSSFRSLIRLSEIACFHSFQNLVFLNMRAS